MFKYIERYMNYGSFKQLTPVDCLKKQDHKIGGIGIQGLDSIIYEYDNKQVARIDYSVYTGQIEPSVLGIIGDDKEDFVKEIIKEVIDITKRRNPDLKEVHECIPAYPKAWESLGATYHVPIFSRKEFNDIIPDSEVVESCKNASCGKGGGYRLKI